MLYILKFLICTGFSDNSLTHTWKQLIWLVKNRVKWKLGISVSFILSSTIIALRVWSWQLFNSVNAVRTKCNSWTSQSEQLCYKDHQISENAKKYCIFVLSNLILTWIVEYFQILLFVLFCQFCQFPVFKNLPRILYIIELKYFIYVSILF